MGDHDAGDPARLARRLWTLRAAILPWLVLVAGPMFLPTRELFEPSALRGLYANLLVPSVPFYLAAVFFCRRRPGLAALVLTGALFLALTVAAGRGAMPYVPYIGWRPPIWAGLLALSQFTIVLAAVRASLSAPPAGPARYLAAVLAVLALLVLWLALAPIHGWTGHRGSTESATIGDIRTMISAQVVYQSANGGFYDVPECLVTPHRCIPAYPTEAPTFLDSRLGQTTVVKNGYRRDFRSGLPADPAAVREAKASPSSLQSWAYVAVPIVRGETGVRGFCGDARGIICYTRDGSAPVVENGQCAASCEILR